MPTSCHLDPSLPHLPTHLALFNTHNLIWYHITILHLYIRLGIGITHSTPIIVPVIDSHAERTLPPILIRYAHMMMMMRRRIM
jgi:hypothetical protein